MEKKVYMISDAAKQIEVESHVLRYWEDELALPIKRNRLGHRCYTTEDVNRLKHIKELKEQGFQLKAIRNTLKMEEVEQIGVEEMALTVKEMNYPMDVQEDKLYRLQNLLKNMMIEAVQEGNRQMEDGIRESIIKELDYQFRMQEEKDEERAKENLLHQEEHYKMIDEMLREKMGSRREKKVKEKKTKDKIAANTGEKHSKWWKREGKKHSVS